MKVLTANILIITAFLFIACGKTDLAKPKSDIKGNVKRVEERQYFSPNNVDYLGRVVSFDNYSRSYIRTYNEEGYLTSLIDKEGKTTYSYSVDDDGIYTKIRTNPKGDKTETDYDNLGRIVSIYNSDNVEIEKYEYYDEKNNLSYKRHEKNETFYKYDEENRVISIIDKYENKYSSQIDYDYSSNKITSKSFSEEDFYYLTDSFYTGGILNKYITYYVDIESSSKEKIKECLFSDNGKKRKIIGKDEYEIEVYNDNNDLILYERYEDNELRTSIKNRFEYDKYGNVALQYHVINYPQEEETYYEITVYNYQYYDGEQLDCQQEFPEIFGGVRTNDTNSNEQSEITNNESSNLGSEFETKQIWVDCLICHGSGQCDACKGEGWDLYGHTDRNFGEISKCVVCHGSGRCQTCYGSKGSYQLQTIRVR